MVPRLLYARKMILARTLSFGNGEVWLKELRSRAVLGRSKVATVHLHFPQSIQSETYAVVDRTIDFFLMASTSFKIGSPSEFLPSSIRSRARMLILGGIGMFRPVPRPDDIRACR